MKEYLARRARRPLEALKPEHEVSDVLEHELTKWLQGLSLSCP